LARCDLIIRGADVIDGTGSKRRRADLAVTGERIAAIGALESWTGDREIQAAGLVLAPGFIDSHTHDDRAILFGADCVLCKLSQGVTTVVVGNCGISIAPVALHRQPPPPLDLLGDASWWSFDSFAAYAERLRATPPPVNALALVGHMSLRVEALDFDVMRAATDAEIARMSDRLAAALDEGAAGLSTGLWYPPSRAAATDEVTELARNLSSRQSLYVTHLRDEGDRVLESVEEALGIGVDAGCAVVLSHHKCALPNNFGKSATTLARIEQAARSQTVELDAYPYAASSTVLVPDSMRVDVPTQVTWSVPHPESAGRMLADLAAEWGVDLRGAAEKLVPAGGVFFAMDEADVRRILAHPRTMIGSDGLPHDQQPHPRLWGTFPRVLGHYVREVGLFDLETAVHKMTGRTASVFGLADRGVLRPGAFADLVLFDPATIIDRATFDKPAVRAAGIRESWVNGQSAYTEAAGVSGATAGRLLQRVAASAAA
jgi:N-acyl-D-amino-acid deacylase